jgi:hypothetical protein
MINIQPLAKVMINHEDVDLMVTQWFLFMLDVAPTYEW